MTLLNGKQIENLQQAILGTFDLNGLRQLLRTRLDRDLSHLTSNTTFSTVVFDVIEAGEREGFTADLLRAVSDERPKRKDLQTLVGELLTVVEGNVQQEDGRSRAAPHVSPQPPDALPGGPVTEAASMPPVSSSSAPHATTRVFVSYSHDSPDHDARVLALADRLRSDGIEAMIDQYVPAPPEGWPKWMDRQLADADFILLVCTETYLRRVMGTEQAGKGLGVRWESTLAYQYLYDAGSESARFIPVLLAGGDPAHVPTPLKGMTYYYPESEEGYDDLYRRLTDQPAVPLPPVGRRKTLPPKRPAPASDVSGALSGVEEGATAGRAVEGSRITPHVSPVDPLLITEPIRMEFVRVDDGRPLRMGTPPGQVQDMLKRFDWAKDFEKEGWFKPEQPERLVRVAPFAIGRYPVTNAQYATFVEATSHPSPKHFGDWGLPPTGKEDHPVVNVSWPDAVAFTEWLSRATGRSIRLPTEVEWEKAARGADGRLWPWGGEWDPKRANTRENGLGDTTPVGAYSPQGDSPCGAADMAGNVLEWCSTKWRADYTTPADDSLTGDDTRVVRGGSWYYSQGSARGACRGRYLRDRFLNHLGFRVVLPLSS